MQQEWGAAARARAVRPLSPLLSLHALARAPWRSTYDGTHLSKPVNTDTYVESKLPYTGSHGGGRCYGPARIHFVLHTDV